MLPGHGINFLPMVRGAEMDKAVEEGLPRGKRALLGFNEPNFPEYFDWNSWSRRRVDESSKLCLNAQVVGDWVVALQVFKNSMIILLSCDICEVDSCSTFECWFSRGRQDNLSPRKAASLWPSVEELARHAMTEIDENSGCPRVGVMWYRTEPV